MDFIKQCFTSEIKSIDENERTITAYVSTKMRDRMDEVLDPEGADLSKFKKNPVVLFAHDYSSPPIGVSLWIKKDEHGLLSKMKFATTAFAEEVFQLFKEGIMHAFSVGFIPKEWTDGDGEKTPKRTYNDWELLEYSAVPVPANPEALALAISKGLLKDEGLKKMLEPEKKEEPKVTVTVTDVDNTTNSSSSAIIKFEGESKSADLLAEIKVLNEEKEALENEILELKFKLSVKNNKPRKLSEMTDEEITEKIKEILAGVIRKTTGKVN